jgi:WD40 repeat protein
VVSAGDDGTIRSWDAIHAGEPAILARRSGAVTAVATVGDAVAFAELHGVRVIALADGHERASIAGHGGTVTQVAATADGRVISVDSDGAVEARSLGDGKLIAASTSVLRATDLAVSADGSVAIGSDDLISRWDPTTGATRTLAKLTRPGGPRVQIEGLVWLDAGRLARVGDDGLIEVRDAQSGRLLAERVTGKLLTSIAVAPDHRRIAAGAQDGTIQIWTPGGRATTLAVHTHAVEDVAFTSDGAAIVSASRDTTVRWTPLDGSPGRTLAKLDANGLAVAVDPRGRWIAAGGDDHTIHLWDGSGAALCSWPAHRRTVTHLAFAADGVLLSAGGDDHTIAQWNVAAVARERRIAVGSPITVAAFDGPDLALGTWSGELRVVRLDGGATLAKYASRPPIRAIAIRGARVASDAGDDKILISSRADLAPISTWATPDVGHDVRALAFDRDGVRLAWGNDAGSWGIRDLASGTDERHGDHKDAIMSLRFAPAGGALAVGHEQGAIELWNHGTLARRFEPSQDMITELTWSLDGRSVAAAGVADRVIVVPSDGTRSINEIASPALSRSIAYTSRRDVWAIGAMTGEIDLLDPDGKLVAAFHAHARAVTAVGFSDDGRTLVSTSGDGTIAMWDLETLSMAPDKLLAAVSARVGLAVVDDEVVVDPAAFSSNLAER